MIKNSKNIIQTINTGKIAVIPTDTIYGLVGSAFSPKVVEKIYNIKARSTQKPLIVLISSLIDLKKFLIVLDPVMEKLLKQIWPGKVSIVLPCPDICFTYLHRSKKSLAFRWPDKPDLVEIIKHTGPLVAPSANLEGFSPATNLQQARQYFGSQVDLYVDGGQLKSEASTLIEIGNNKKIKILRPGAGNIEAFLSKVSQFL